MDAKEAKDILFDMRDQHLCFIGDLEIKDEWQKNYLKEAWACDSGAKALEKQIPCKPEEYVFRIFRTIYFPLKNVRNAEHLLLVKK
jgi:hypothetical protein